MTIRPIGPSAPTPQLKWLSGMGPQLLPAGPPLIITGTQPAGHLPPCRLCSAAFPPWLTLPGLPFVLRGIQRLCPCRWRRLSLWHQDSLPRVTSLPLLYCKAGCPSWLRFEIFWKRSAGKQVGSRSPVRGVEPEDAVGEWIWGKTRRSTEECGFPGRKLGECVAISGRRARLTS